MGMKLKCKSCGDIIEGDKKGHLITCSCGKTCIDETPYYARIIGNPSDFVQIDENGNEMPFIADEEKELPKRRDKINYYLDMAEATLKRSTCLRKQYGAIIVKNDEIISSGYNGAPRGMLSCLDINTCRREEAERGTDYSNCVSCHAEMNAIISASRQEMIGSTMYLVGMENNKYVENPNSCSICKRLIINAGIKRLIVRKSENDFDMFEVSEFKIDDITGGY